MLQNTHHHSYHLLPKHKVQGKIINKEEICNQVGVVFFFLGGGERGREGKQDLRKDAGFTN